MMDISKLGTNIRLLREEKGLTREQFCEEEKELSSRQLMRIEKGQSTPTLEKLIYIAAKLDINVIKLFDVHATLDFVPREYWGLKQELENYSSFDEGEREIRLGILMKMYDYYYDGLPADEQLFIDCMMTLNDVYETLKISFLMTTINKYKYVLEKESFAANELVYLSLYFILQIETNAWDTKTDEILEKIVRNTVYRNRFTAEVLVRIYVNITTYYIVVKRYEDAVEKLNVAVKLITEMKVYNRLPVIYMLLGKSYIGLGNKHKGKHLYNQAVTLASLLHLDSLKTKIQNEKDADVL